MLTLVRLFALQSVALGLLALAVAYFTDAPHIYVVAVLTIGLKGVVIPWVLLYVMDKIKIDKEVEPLVSIPLSLLLCGVLTIVAFYVTQPIIFTSGAIDHHHQELPGHLLGGRADRVLHHDLAQEGHHPDHRPADHGERPVPGGHLRHLRHADDR